MTNEQKFQVHLNGQGVAELRKLRLPAYATYDELKSSGNRFGTWDKYWAYLDSNGNWQSALLDIYTAVDLGGANTSDTKLSSQKAVKTYVDAIQTALGNAITTAVSNAQNTLTAQMNNLRKITAWNATDAFPTVRSFDGLPYKEGDYLQITATANGYKAGDILIATTDGVTTVEGFVDKAETTDIATNVVYGTVRLISDLAELNSNLPANDSKVITQAVFKSKIDAVVNALTVAYQAADTALQTAITTAYQSAIGVAKAEVIALYEAADTALQTQITNLGNTVAGLATTVANLGATVTQHETRIANIEGEMPIGKTVATSTVTGVVKSVSHNAGKKARIVQARDTTDGTLIDLAWNVDDTDTASQNNKINILTLGSMSSLMLEILCY